LTKKHDVHPCPAIKKIGIQFNLLPQKKPKIYYLGKEIKKIIVLLKKKSKTTYQSQSRSVKNSLTLQFHQTGQDRIPHLKALIFSWVLALFGIKKRLF